MNAPVLRSMYVFAGFAAGVFFVIACPKPTQSPAPVEHGFGPPVSAASTIASTGCAQWSVKAAVAGPREQRLEAGWEPFAVKGDNLFMRACVP